MTTHRLVLALVFGSMLIYLPARLFPIVASPAGIGI
jgi:hypothetical protein